MSCLLCRVGNIHPYRPFSAVRRAVVVHRPPPVPLPKSDGTPVLVAHDCADITATRGNRCDTYVVCTAGPPVVPTTTGETAASQQMSSFLSSSPHIYWERSLENDRRLVRSGGPFQQYLALNCLTMSIPSGGFRCHSWCNLVDVSLTIQLEDVERIDYISI